jgi:hypothetical protein
MWKHKVYYAGLQPLDEQEIRSLGFPTMTLKGGTYARVKLMDWNDHADRSAGYSMSSWKSTRKIRMDPPSSFTGASLSSI